MNSTLTTKAPSTARVAQLSESARERINNLIRCGAANTEIMFRLREEAPDLMHAHLNWWREHGYLEWLPKQPPLGQKLYYERISRQAAKPQSTQPEETAAIADERSGAIPCAVQAAPTPSAARATEKPSTSTQPAPASAAANHKSCPASSSSSALASSCPCGSHRLGVSPSFPRDLAPRERDTESTLSVAAAQIHDALRELDPAILKAEDLADFNQLTQVLVRLSECSMKCERHRFDLATEAEDRARARSNSEARHGLTPETLSQIEHELNLQ